MTYVVVLAVAACWVLVGALLGLRESRRGHWRWLWVLGALGGPFSIPLFRQIEQNESLAKPITVTSGSRSDHDGLHVLVGVDGSDTSLEAARTALEMLGNRVGNVTVALVADYEVNETLPVSLDTEEAADHEFGRELLRAANDLGSGLGFEPASVLLSGRPATALHDFAVQEHLDVIAIGTSGRGVTKHLLGSCARQLMEQSTIPLVAVPDRNRRAGAD